MAVNCSVPPTVMLAAGFGATVIDVSTGAVTVRLTTGDEVTAPTLAVIFVLPAATPVANPCVPAVLLIVAAAVLDDAHVAVVVTIRVELSE